MGCNAVRFDVIGENEIDSLRAHHLETE